jgi:excisionase family DNA binding protein
MDGKASGGL